MLVITAAQLVCHGVGDYWFQSDWMAGGKTSKSFPCICHVICYTAPFLFLTISPLALLFILLSHYLIDRYRLARYLVFAKNFLSPPSEWERWEDCQATGYHKDRLPFLAVWLLIIADNLMHIFCNAFAIQYL